MTWLREAGVDGAFIAACFALAALGAGRLVWRGRKLDVRLLVEQFAIGFGLLGMLTVAAGALGLFHWPLMLVLIFFLITVLIYLTKLRMVSATLVPRGALEIVGVAVMLILFVTGLLAALGPELEPDALSYHLPAAVDWARTGSDPFNVHNYPTGYPLLAEANFAWLALAGRPEAARVLHWFAMLLAALATALLGARVAGRGAGILAATIFAGVPMIAWTAQTANTEGFGLLFFVLAVLRLDDHLREGKRGDLAASAIFLGLCASTKIWNLLFIPLFAAVVCAFWLRLARQKKARLSASWRYAILFGAVALAIYAPWAIRAYSRTGDPFFPVYSLGLRHYRFPLSRIFVGVRAMYGLGRGWRDLALIGWRLTFAPERFGDLAIGWLLLPLATFGLFRVRRWPLLALLTPIAGLTLLVWFFTSQQVRYLAPLFPYVAVLAAAPVVEAAKKRAWRWLPAAVALLALTGWAPLVHAQWPGAGFTPKVYGSLLAGRATRDQIRERFAYNDEWSLWRFMNSTVSCEARIFGDGAQAQWWADYRFADVNYDPYSTWLFDMRNHMDAMWPVVLPTHFILNVTWANRYGNARGQQLCQAYTNGSLVVLERRPDADDCMPPPLAPDEPFRWVEVASPRDPHGYWWIGATARLMLARGARLEIVAPFAAQGVTKLAVTIGNRPPSELEITDQRIIAFDARPDEVIELTAPRTVDPIALGYGGDPAPKSFLVRVITP
jgi:hypothetical protein